MKGRPLAASFLVLAACSSGARTASPTPTPSTAARSVPTAATPQPRDALDGERMFGAFLDATYTPHAAGGWYRGGGERSASGNDVQYEVLVRASTPAEALAFCPAVATAAAYFLRNSDYQLTLSGRVDVPIAGGVTFKDAAFAPVACTAAPNNADPVRATMPDNAAAATTRLSAFLDDYLRASGDGFGFTTHGVDAHGVQTITVSISGATGGAARCATLRPFITWFLGRFPAQTRVQPERGATVTC